MMSIPVLKYVVFVLVYLPLNNAFRVTTSSVLADALTYLSILGHATISEHLYFFWAKPIVRLKYVQWAVGISVARHPQVLYYLRICDGLICKEWWFPVRILFQVYFYTK